MSTALSLEKLKAPRLRFAPSPTGYLHIGGVRTALFNWLWAKQTGGTFILRIEDTDRERSTPENEAVILHEMRWLGLDWGEGPDVGGPFGPYRQMERLALYKEYADKLIEKKHAFRCYCTKEELDTQREELKKKDPKAQFRYPGTCKNRVGAPPDLPFVVRMNAPTTGSVVYTDMVFGEITTPNNTLQDAVIMRSDGVPLYNLGAVVDDITMQITIVARGRDHMINTPIQILLYEMLGVTPPRFAHLPMMLGPSGNKLSKRDGAVSVADYREQGIPPKALLNYLVRFGWSHGDQEVFSLDELVRVFDWDHCGRGDGKFDKKRLDAISFEHLSHPELTSDDAYVAGVLPFLEKRGLTSVDEGKLRQALPLVRPRAVNFVEAAHLLDFFFRDPPAVDEKAAKKFLTKERAPLLRGLAGVFRAVGEFEPTAIDAAATAWLSEKSIELKEMAQPARVALTGRTASPGLYEVAAILGRERSIARLERAAEVAEQSA